MVKSVLGDDTCVATPPTIRLYTAGLGLAALELGSLNDVTILVANGLAGNAVLRQELDPFGLLGISIEVLAPAAQSSCQIGCFRQNTAQAQYTYLTNLIPFPPLEEVAFLSELPLTLRPILISRPFFAV